VVAIWAKIGPPGKMRTLLNLIAGPGEPRRGAQHRAGRPPTWRRYDGTKRRSLSSFESGFAARQAIGFVFQAFHIFHPATWDRAGKKQPCCRLVLQGARSGGARNASRGRTGCCGRSGGAWATAPTSSRCARREGGALRKGERKEVEGGGGGVADRPWRWCNRPALVAGRRADRQPGSGTRHIRGLRFCWQQKGARAAPTKRPQSNDRGHFTRKEGDAQKAGGDRVDAGWARGGGPLAKPRPADGGPPRGRENTRRGWLLTHFRGRPLGERPAGNGL